MKQLLIILVSLSLFSCSSSKDFEKGKQQLESQGYTNIEDTGHEWFCCSEEDDFSTGFTAKDKSGKAVSGCFCSSIGKGITIRFN